MLTVNIDIEDRLINGQVGLVAHIEIINNAVKKVYVKFDDCTAGRKRMSLNVFARQNNWVHIEKCETEIKIIKRSQASPYIRRTQFSLALGWASTSIVSSDSLTLVLLNTRSLAKHALDISKDQRHLNNDFICFTETQLKLTQSVCETSETLQNFNMHFNNNENQFLSIAYGYGQSVSVLDHEHYRGLSEITILKNSFVELPFKISLLYRKNSEPELAIIIFIFIL